MSLRINIEKVDGVTVVDLAGELNAGTSFDLHETVVRLIKEGTRSILLNHKEMVFIDSVGLGTLVRLFKYAAQTDRLFFKLFCLVPTRIYRPSWRLPSSINCLTFWPPLWPISS